MAVQELGNEYHGDFYEVKSNPVIDFMIVTKILNSSHLCR